MTFNEAVEECHKLDVKPYLIKAPKGGYICPKCGSGTGNNGNHTGGVKYYQETRTSYCHACNAKKRIGAIDMVMYSQHCDFKSAVYYLAAEYHWTIDEKENSEYWNRPEVKEGLKRMQERVTAAGNTASIPSLSATPPAATPAEDSAAEAPADNSQATGSPAAVDYTAYYKVCGERLRTSEAARLYLEKRGISLATALAAGLGFDPAADVANAPGAISEEAVKKYPCPRIIIPSNAAHYVGRRIDGIKEYEKMNPKGSKPGIINLQALYDDQTQPVFVCEGAFSALSLMEIGVAAIATNSASNIDLLLQQLEARPTKATLLLLFDNDKAGISEAAKLREGLQRLNITCMDTAPQAFGSSYNAENAPLDDANDLLCADREAFEDFVTRAIKTDAARPDNTSSYIDLLMGQEITKFKAGGEKLTGFDNLDEEAGGLYSGLYVLAAIPSLGKTTLALQMADQLAAGGNDVIFFSLEQSRLELVSKCIARRTEQRKHGCGVTSLAIRRGEGLANSNTLEAKEAFKEEVGNRLSIIEGNFNCDIAYIRDYISGYIDRTGRRPIVFIDYLQILQPTAEGKAKGSKKDEIDLAVQELKRLTREKDITVIVISSVNRANYAQEFSFESLKESGGIEFTADVVWGLQLLCLDEKLFTEKEKVSEKRKRIKEAKGENPRKIKFICDKNRYGKSNYSCGFNYYPQYDLFVPISLYEPVEGAASFKGSSKGGPRL